MNYVEYIRGYVKDNPIILNGVSVLIFNENNELLLQKRTYPKKTGVFLEDLWKWENQWKRPELEKYLKRQDYNLKN